MATQMDDELDLTGEAKVPMFDELQKSTRGFKIRFSEGGFSGQRKVSDRAREEFANRHHAEAAQVSVAKKLLDSRHPLMKQYNAAKGAILEYFRSRTMWSPVEGVRMLRMVGTSPEERNRETQEFLDHMRMLIEEYDDFVLKLSEPENWRSIVETQREKLGNLFSADNYVSAQELRQMLRVELLPASLDHIPGYYKQLAPAEYARQLARVQQDYETIALVAKSEIVTEMQKVVEDFQERVKKFHTGEAKSFTNSVVTNVQDVIADFNLRCKGLGFDTAEIEVQLHQLVELMSRDRFGHKVDLDDMAEKLRKDRRLADNVLAGMATIGENLAELATITPRRAIVRRASGE